MICRDVEARITAYLDGELDATTSSALRGHLRSCDACRALSEDHARIAGALAALHDDPSRAEPPAALWNGVMAKLADAEASDARRSRWSLAGRSLWQRLRSHLLPATAVAAAVTVAAFWLATRSDRSEPPRHASDDEAVSPAAPPAPTPTPPPAPSGAPQVDIEVALAAEAERVDRLYTATAAELLEVAAEERDGWPAARRRAYDAELARLRAVLEAAPRPLGSQFGDDELEIAEAGERRERAWQKLISFLQRAALGEMFAEVRR